MVCGDSTILAKVAMIIMIVSVVCGTIAIFSPWWNSEQNTSGETVYSGLIVTCDNTLGYCFDLNTMLSRYSDSGFYKTILATLSLAMIGWVFGIAAMIVMIVYACLPNKITAVVTIILAYISGGTIIASVILYGVGLNSFISATLSYSFALDASAGILAIFAGTVAYVNSCLIP